MDRANTAVASHVAKVLTADGGRFEVQPNMREMLCFADDGTLYISQSHETNLHVLGFRERLTRNAIPYRVELTSLSAIKELYANNVGHSAVNSKNVTVRGADVATHRQTEVVRLFKDAVELGASDIHFIVDDKRCLVRFRINGDLETQKELLAQDGKDLCGTIYQSMCDVADSTYNPYKSQDARVKRDFVKQCGLFGARVATRPTDRGNLMVLRLIYDNSRGNKLTLENAGYLPEQIAQIRRMRQRTTGINVFSGPTGSGKSTTLERVLSELLAAFDNKIHLLTIEDPPEYAIAGAIQTPMMCDKDDDEAVSREWARSISNSLRLDPDVMMVGEMRDLASAVAAFRAAMTGHGVWTTLHANDVMSILERLRDIGVEVSLLTDPALITGLINQWLVRKICQECAKDYVANRHTVPADLADRIDHFCDPAKVRLKGDGCKKCKGTGISGRTVIAEVVVPTMRLMTVFKQHGKSEARSYWVKHMHGITKNRHLIQRINEGLVDPAHGERDVCALDEDIITLGDGNDG